MADVNANINIDINSSDAIAGLKRLEGQINAFQRSVSSGNAAAMARQAAVNRALTDGINATGLFTAKQIAAVDSAAKFTNALEKNKLTLNEYTRYAASQLPGLSRVFRREFETMERVATDRVKAINSQYVAMGKTVDGVTRAIKSTPTGLAKGYGTDLAVTVQRQQMFNKLIDDGSTKLLNWGKNTQWAGRQLMVGLSLPMAAFGAAAAAAFMELDKATVQLKRVYGDLNTTTAEVNANAEAIKALGAEYTKYGIAVADTIQLGARAAATGATNETLLAATEQTLRFATLGQIDYNQALDTTISLQTAFGVANEDLAQKIDFLNAVENQTILTIEDMSLAIPRVATVVKGLGGDVEDLAVMMTAMREGGVSAENAANGLKSGLASMINPTKRAKEMLNGLGINLEGIVDQYQGDLLGTIKAFGLELDKLSDMDRQRALEKTFGKYQYARMSALFDNITAKSGQAARAMDLAGYSTEQLAEIAERELGTISESTTVKFQAALEKLRLSIAPIGEAFLKIATPALDAITKIANAFNGLPEPIKNAIGVATVAIAGLGPVLLMGIGLMGNLIANIIKGVQWWRKLGARIKGEASAFEYMTRAELDAMAATEALESSTQSLTGKLQLQAGAVSALTKEYGRFVSAAGAASGAMGAFPAARGGGGRGNRPQLKMARGGVVPGSGSGDKVPALLEPGETVVTKQASKQYAPIIAAMNAGTLPGFQGGLDPQSARETLVFAHAQAPKDLADDIVQKIKSEATGSKYLQQATSMQGLSNFGVVAPEKFNRGQMTGTQAAKLFQDPAIVDRTMYPMYEAIARSMGAKTPAQVKQIMSDPAIQNDVRSFANNIGTGLARAGAQKIGDADFYRVVEQSLQQTPMSQSSKAAIEKSRNITTVAAYGGGIRAKGERVALGQSRQQRIFGQTGGVSYKSTSMVKKAGLVLGGKFGEAVRTRLKIKSPSEDAKEVVRQYVDGMEVGAQQNAADAAKAGKTTANAYTGAVSQSVNATSGRQMTKEQYKAQQSQRRRDARNIDVMYAGGMTDDTQILRTLRRQRQSEEKAKRAKAIAERRQAQSRQAEENRILMQQQAAEQRQSRRTAAEERLRRIKSANRRAPIRSAGRRAGRMAMGAGGVLGAASMVPFMAQDEQGQFAGMNANTLGMGMMGASMVAPMIPMVAKLAMAHPIITGVVAAVAAVTVGFVALKKSFDSSIEAGRQLADSITTNAEEQQAMADVFGTTTYAARRKQKEATKMTGLTTEQQEQGREFVQTDQGKSMVEEAQRGFESQGKAFAATLGTQLSQMVLSGAISPTNAKAIAVGITEAVGREEMAVDVTSQINKILAPNGDDVTNTPLKIAAEIEASMAQDEDMLAKEVEVRGPETFGFFERLTQGEYDEAARKAVAYAQTVTANTASMISSFDDQIMAQEDSIAALDEKIKAEEDATKREELIAERRKAVNVKNSLEEQKKKTIEDRRIKEMAAYAGRAEAIHAGRLSAEERGIGSAGAMFGRDAAAVVRTNDDGTQEVTGYGGIMGKYLYERTGVQLDREQGEQFEIGYIVDIESGRIDAQALQLLQRMEEQEAGTASNILGLVAELQFEGDWEQANQISTLAASMDKEYVTIFNSEVEGDADPEWLIAYGNLLNQLPPNVDVSITTELAGMTIEEIEQFRGSMEALQGLGIDTAELIKTGGVDAINQASEGLEKLEKQLKSKKVQKGLDEITKMDKKDVKGRLTKQIEVTTELTDKDGKKITPSQAKAAQDKVIADSGLDEQAFAELPPDVATKVIAMQVNADQYKDMAIAARIAANAAKGKDPAEAARQTELADMYNAIYQAYSSAAKMGAQTGGGSMGMGGGGSGGAPPVSEEEPAGGGGDKADPYKDMKKGILNQIKTFADANAKMSELLKGKQTFFGLLEKNRGIEDQIAKLGLSGPLAEQLRGMDPADAAKVIGRITGKGGRLNEEGQRLNRLSVLGSVAQRTDEATQRVTAARAQTAAAADLQKRGLASATSLSVIAGDPEVAQEYIALVKEADAAEERWKRSGSKRQGKLWEEWQRAQRGVKGYVDQIVKAQRLEEGAAGNIAAQQRAAEIAEQKMLAATATARGASVETVDAILSDPSYVNRLAVLQEDAREKAEKASRVRKNKGKNSNAYREAQQEAQAAQQAVKDFPITIQAEIEMEPLTFEEQMQKSYDEVMQPLQEAEAYFEMQFTKIEQAYSKRIQDSEKLITSINKQIQVVQDEIDALEELNQADQRRIRGLERQKEILNRQIEQLDRANEIDQRRIDAINRQAELIQRQVEAINRQNELDERRTQALQRQQEMMQRQVDSINDQIETTERANELDERRIENASREDELRQRIAESISRELELMSRQEDEIKKAYDERIQKLDEIEAINQRISQQNQDQLALVQALAQGDIYTAAAAAQQLRQTQIENSRQGTRTALEQGMQNQIAGLRTSGGLTREQAEGQVQTVEDQSYQTQLAIRDIQDQIYTRTQALIPLRDQIYAIELNIKAVDQEVLAIQDAIYNRNLESVPLLDQIYNLEQSTLGIQDLIYQRNLDTLPLKDAQRVLDDQIRVINDAIFARETEILGIQDSRLTPLQKSLTAESRKLDTLKEQMQTEKDSVTYQGMTYSQLNDTIQTLSGMYGYQQALLRATNKNGTAAAAVANQWAAAAHNIKEANRLAKSMATDANTVAARMAEVAPDKTTGLVDPRKAAEAKANAADWLAKELARIEAARQAAIGQIKSDAANYQVSQFAVGGQVTGLIAGTGARDSIMAKLTPGEYVIRKSMVDKYGLPMLTDINNGSFELPKYNVTQPVTMRAPYERNAIEESSSPVYNTYSVNVNVPNANISADEVANKVLYKMKSIESSGVRSYRGF